MKRPRCAGSVSCREAPIAPSARRFQIKVSRCSPARRLKSRAPRQELSLVEAANAPDLAPQRDGSLEFDPDLSPRLRAPVRVQHHAPDAVDAEPRGVRGRRGGQSRTQTPLRCPHTDALVSDPRSILYRGGLINPPDVSVDALAAFDRVRSAGDFPLTGFVGEAVSDLEVPREDVVGHKPDPSP